MMEDMITPARLRLIGSIASLFLWLQGVFWLRLFDSTAMYVSLLIRTIRDISYFMIVMLMIMGGFGTAFLILQYNRIYQNPEEEGLLFPHAKGELLLSSAMISQYFMMLGDFGGLNLNDSNSVADRALVTIFFIMTTFIVQVTILNMLIAIMSETFSEHM